MSRAWSKKENKLLYTAIQNASQDYKNVEIAKKSIIEEFGKVQGVRKLVMRELEGKLGEMCATVNAAGGKIDRGKLISTWATCKSHFIAASQPTKIKLTKKSNQRKASSAGSDSEYNASEKEGKQQKKPDVTVGRPRSRRSDTVEEGQVSKGKSPQNPKNSVSDKQALARSAASSDELPPGTSSNLSSAPANITNTHQTPKDADHYPATTSGPTDIRLYPWERRFIDHMRTIGYGASVGFRVAPDAATIRRTIDNSLRKISKGVEYFLRARPSTRLTSTNAGVPTQELTRVLVGQDNWNRRRVVEALSDGPNTTIPALLRAYAAAAIYAWVLNGFDEIIRKVRVEVHGVDNGDMKGRKILEGMLKNYSDMFAGIDQVEYVEFVDTAVKDFLTSYAEQFEDRLYEVFRSLCVWNSAPSDHAERNLTANNSKFLERLQLDEKWQKLVREAFSELLDLRLKSAVAPTRYTFKFPEAGTEFKEAEMDTFDRFAQVDTDARVVLCVRPSVWAAIKSTAEDEPMNFIAAEVLIDENTSNLVFY